MKHRFPALLCAALIVALLLALSPMPACAAYADGDYTANFEGVPAQEYAITVVQVEGVVISAPASAHAGETVTVATQTEPGFRLVSLFYYTDDPANAVAIPLGNKQFVMPDADVTVSGVTLPASKGDVNLDGLVNIVDVDSDSAAQMQTELDMYFSFEEIVAIYG